MNMNKPSLSVIILTRDEELNLAICLKSVENIAQDIFVVDSGSSDKTVEIAKRMGAKVVWREFSDFATQFNWGLDNLPITTEWVMKLDADERLTPALAGEIANLLPFVPGNVSGFLMKRRVYFMGRWIKHGGYYPTWILRLFRKGKGRLEGRAMDEHTIISDGLVKKLKNDFIDENHKELTFWIRKHNDYASREMKDFIAAGHFMPKRNLNLGGGQIEMKRMMKTKLYYKLPMFFRARLYYCYRYWIRLGFLDGREGKIFHFLQGYWYRFLVDAKIYEMKKSTKKNS